mgnify:CR=1 FL=1
MIMTFSIRTIELDDLVVFVPGPYSDGQRKEYIANGLWTIVSADRQNFRCSCYTL